MVYKGRVLNGVVVLEDGVQLPEGAKVRVWLVSEEDAKSVASQPLDDSFGKRESPQ